VGKLLEVDLGPTSTLKNIARTRAAIHGGEDEQESETNGKKGWWAERARRRRNRRNSDEVRRDQMVEKVMQESKCRFLSLRIYPKKY
jgi:hypothetical protein